MFFPNSTQIFMVGIPQRMVFNLNMVLPVASDARGLISTQEFLLFAAANSIFQLRKNKIIFLISLHGQIEDIFFENGFLFAKTRSMFYMIINDKIVATMKMKTEFSFTVLDQTLFIANQKNISQYELPKEFKSFPFEKICDVRAHSDQTLRMIPLPLDNMVLSIGTDCTVRLNSARHSISKILTHFTEEPIAIFYELIGIKTSSENTGLFHSEDTVKERLRNKMSIENHSSMKRLSNEEHLSNEFNTGHILHEQGSDIQTNNTFYENNHTKSSFNGHLADNNEQSCHTHDISKQEMPHTAPSTDTKDLRLKNGISGDLLSHYKETTDVIRPDILTYLKNDYEFTAISSNGKFFQFCSKNETLLTKMYLNRPILSASQRGNTFFLLGADKFIYVIKNQTIAQLSVEEQGHEITCNKTDIFIRGEYFINQYHCPDSQIDNLIFEKISKNNSGDISLTAKNTDETSSDSTQNLLLMAPIPLPRIIDFSYNEDIAVISDNHLIIRYEFSHDHMLIVSFMDVEEPVIKVFFKKNVILVITESSKVKAFDTTRSIKFRDIQLETDLLCADTNVDNSLLIFGDNTHFHLLDIRTSKILESIGTSTPISNIYSVNNTIFCLLMSNDIIKYDILTRKYDSFESKTTIHFLKAMNQKLVLSYEKTLLINNIQMETEKVLNCSFKSRSRNEMAILEKPVTVLTLSYDDRILICGARANKLRVYDISTGILLQTIKLTRNKELENYKKKLGREPTHEFTESNVIEAFKIEYCPNGFFLLSREGIFLYRTEYFNKMPILNQIRNTGQLESTLKEGRWIDAVNYAVSYENIEDLSKIINTLPVNAAACVEKVETPSEIQKNFNNSMPINPPFNWLSILDTTIKGVNDPKGLKNLLNTILLTNYHPKPLLWLNRLIYLKSRHNIDSDMLVIELLKHKYSKI